MPVEAGTRAGLFWLFGESEREEEIMITKRSLGCIVLCALLSACASAAGFPGRATLEADQHCTVLYAADDQVALGGNNEDNFRAGLTHIWFIPPEEGRYGMALVGYDDFLNPEGAVNDQGLFYDALAVREVKIPSKEGTIPYYGLPMMKIMTE